MSSNGHPTPKTVEEIQEACRMPIALGHGTLLAEEAGAGIMRQFDTGATRPPDEGKLDYEGFLSPLVLRRYAEFLDSHRELEDGTTRDSDNWQKGMPLSVHMKSMWRHFMDTWTRHRLWDTQSITDAQAEELEVALCGVIFNASGYLHELVKKRLTGQEISSNAESGIWV